jgi:apolipoprotein N-acyltransferase
MLRKMRKKVDFLFCLLCAILLAAPFLNHRLWVFSWFAFVPLLRALKDKNPRRSFVIAFFTGAVFWLITLYWLVNVTFLGQIILAVYLALYFGLFGLLNYYLLRLKYYVFLIPCAWVILEYLRSHLLTGFPWALLGYSQYANIAVIQLADITGAWGVSFLVMIFNAAIFLSLEKGPSSPAKVLRIFLLPAVILALSLGYGHLRIDYINDLLAKGASRQVRLSVIQPNIPQELKWDARARYFIKQRYIDLTLSSAKGSPDLIIWPEAALPSVPQEDPQYYADILGCLRSIGRSVLLGAVTSRNGLYYNSALLFSIDGRLLAQYDKLHLVPFGEYIPFRNTLRFLDTIAPIGDIARGREYTIFKSPLEFGVLICFEDVFPGLSRNFVKRGARLLVNITNDAWFGRTSEAYQHLAASVFRAVENRVNLARAANTGVSAFILPSGKILSQVEDLKHNAIFVQGYKSAKITILPAQHSFYNRCGDVFLLFCLLFPLYVIISAKIRRK